MKTCESCIYHDPEPIPLRAWQNGRWVTSMIVEFKCLKHVPSQHYKSDYCPDHTEKSQ